MSRLALICMMLLIGNTGCRQDFRITAAYREIPVVYGLIDIQDTVHYLRIQRAFIDSATSALVQAALPDSLYYPDILDATVTNDCTGQVYLLERVAGDTIGLPKEAGLFARQPNILYRFQAPLTAGTPLRLRMLNRATGLETTAEAVTIDAFTSLFPAQNGTINWLGESNEVVTFSWRQSAMAMVYDMQLEFQYYDIPRGTQDSIPRSISFSILAASVTNIGASLNVVTPFAPVIFYQFCGSRIPEDTTVMREPASIVFRITAGGEALGMLIANQQVQQGITAGNALTGYTNITEGHGIFSSRYTLELHNRVGDITREMLTLHPATRHLGFRK